MNQKILDLQERVAKALKAGQMSREEAIKKLVEGGFSRGLAFDFVSVILDHRGE